jgi:rRNA maturation endonuclease Nob1
MRTLLCQSQRVELNGIKVRAALASFETAAKYGLEFPPEQTMKLMRGRKHRRRRKSGPQCGKKVPLDELMNECCPWCGWRSAKTKKKEKIEDLPLLVADN